MFKGDRDVGGAWVLLLIFSLIFGFVDIVVVSFLPLRIASSISTSTCSSRLYSPHELLDKKTRLSFKMNYAPVSSIEEFTTEQSRDTDECTRCLRGCDCSASGACFIEGFAGCFAAIWGCIVALGEGCGQCCGEVCGSCCV